MSASLKISDGMTAADLRLWARRCGNGRAAARAYAIANALDGLDRAEAARLAGMERQALRDAVWRYNVEGVAGLFDRPKGHRAEWLSDAEQAALAAAVFKGPDPAARTGFAAGALTVDHQRHVVDRPEQQAPQEMPEPLIHRLPWREVLR